MRNVKVYYRPYVCSNTSVTMRFPLMASIQHRSPWNKGAQLPAGIYANHTGLAEISQILWENQFRAKISKFLTETIFRHKFSGKYIFVQNFAKFPNFSQKPFSDPNFPKNMFLYRISRNFRISWNIRKMSFWTKISVSFERHGSENPARRAYIYNARSPSGRHHRAAGPPAHRRSFWAGDRTATARPSQCLLDRLLTSLYRTADTVTSTTHSMRVLHASRCRLRLRNFPIA